MTWGNSGAGIDFLHDIRVLLFAGIVALVLPIGSAGRRGFPRDALLPVTVPDPGF